MASLLERMDITPVDGSSGPIRSRGGRAGSMPYSGRPHKLGQSKADADNVWKHDLYTGPGKTLGSRLTDVSASQSAPRVNASGAALALRQAVGLSAAKNAGRDLSIRGASAIGSNVVQIEHLAPGTTAADVETFFKRCGPILESYVHGAKDAKEVTVRLKFKNSDGAQRALDFDGKAADDHVLRVTVVGSASTSLGGRLGGGVLNGTVDVLMDEDPDAVGGSKMRSDDLLSDPRAQVMVVPPGVDPAEYEQRDGRGFRGRGGRRGGRRGRGRRGGGGMDLD